MAHRVNRAIELLSNRQPIYYVGGHTDPPHPTLGRLTANHSPVLTYEQGKIDAGTWADHIDVGMEHGAFDLAGLNDYLRGMVDAGPTRSGHRTPTVIVEAPVGGYSREMVRFNSWLFQQILARGVHGIMLPMTTVPEGVEAYVECCRYPINRLGVGKGLGVGTRGVGSEPSAAHIWGVDRDTYVAKADPWPLNPEGELMLGIKIESKAAVPHIEEILAVPGIAFAELGPSDMSLSLGYQSLPSPWPEEIVEIEDRVKAACIANGVAYHWTQMVDDVPTMIDGGGQVFDAPNEEFAKAGRDHTRRQLPV